MKVAKFLTPEKLPKWPLIWLWSRAGFLWPPATLGWPPGQRLQKPKWMLLFPHTDSHSPSFTKQDSCLRGLHAKFLPVPPDQACPSHVHRDLDLQNQPKSGSSALFKALRTNRFHLPSLGDALSDRCPEGSAVPNLSWRHHKLYSHHPAGHARRLSFSGPICRQWEAGLLHREIPGKNLINRNPSIMHNGICLTPCKLEVDRVCGVWWGKKAWNKLILVTKINNNKMTQNTHREPTCCVRRHHFAIVSQFWTAL